MRNAGPVYGKLRAAFSGIARFFASEVDPNGQTTVLSQKNKVRVKVE